MLISINLKKKGETNVIFNYRSNNWEGNIIFEDTEAKNGYNALVRYRKDNPDGKYLKIEKKRYGRRKRWTLTLGGKEYVAEEHFSVYDTMARREDSKGWFIDETFNSRNMNDGW